MLTKWIGILYKKQKVEFGPLEKGGSMLKLIITVKKLIFDKPEGEDFKYDNSFFKFQSKTTQNKAVLVPNLFFLHETYILRNTKALILNMSITFSNCSSKIPK